MSNVNLNKPNRNKLLISIILCILLLTIIIAILVNKDYIETYLIEWNADNSYYGRICNDCKFHKEKIQQSIDAGVDAEWWNHMCTDFCR